MSRKIFPIYTKSFGGKIWKNLHSVSPDNNFGKKFKMAPLKISRQKGFKHNLVQKKLTFGATLKLRSGKKSLANFSEYICLSCARLCQVNRSSRILGHFLQGIKHGRKYRVCMRMWCQIFFIRFHVWNIDSL